MITFHLHQYIEQMNATIDKYCVFFDLLRARDYPDKNEIKNVIYLLVNHKLLLQGTMTADLPIGLNLSE